MVFGIDLGHVPFVEFKADVALDPGERILLADRDEDVVAGDVAIRFAGGLEAAPALGVELGFHMLENDAGEAAVVVGEFLGHEIIEDRDALVHGIFLLPRRGLHLLEAGTNDDGHLLAAETARGAAAVHGGVAAAEDDDAPADLGYVAERDAGEPVDADMDVLGGLVTAWNVEVAAARRARPDENRVAVLGDQRFEAVDATLPRNSTPRSRM